ncbi:MAG: glycosyl transferase [Gammaproteobacteria bacterium]|nr:glycosyl transferase [Gammaproteobacteria bacterium]
MSNPRVLFYTQHLLGIGHLSRAATLARGLAARGFDVRLVSGGYPVAEVNVSDLDFVQLPPVRATDLHFRELVDETGTPVDDQWKRRRRDALLSVANDLRPHVVLTELFPFGRRQMRFELIPFLEAVVAQQPRPLVVSSVRDILVEPSKPGRTQEMLDRIKRFYDLVLVHGDPNLIPFSRTFPRAAQLPSLRYTGYVVERGDVLDAPSRGRDVLVSAGGGAVALRLIDAVLAARELGGFGDRHVRILLGSALPAEEFERLASLNDERLTVERARRDFRRLLREAALSISQGGYNTVMEVLDAKVPAIVVPYSGGVESEQTLRATLLAQRGAITHVPEDTLDAHTLVQAVDSTLANGPSEFSLDVDGIAKTSKILHQLIA